MFIPEIPNNALSKHINTIVQLSIILANDFGKNAFKFDKPLSSEEIETWEKEHKITQTGLHSEGEYCSKILSEPAITSDFTFLKSRSKFGFRLEILWQSLPKTIGNFCLISCFTRFFS